MIILQIPRELKSDFIRHLGVSMLDADDVAEAFQNIQDETEFEDEEKVQLLQYFVDQDEVDLLFGLKLIKCKDGKLWFLKKVFLVCMKFLFLGDWNSLEKCGLSAQLFLTENPLMNSLFPYLNDQFVDLDFFDEEDAKDTIMNLAKESKFM